MMPVYRYMDSYPHQGTLISSGQNYYPSMEAVPPHTKFDPSKPVIINQPLPYPNNFNYCVPCYPYSSDPHFPGYYSHGGFYAHPPMPQFHCCGHQYHPPFPGPLPAQYVPSPYCVKELPRYEFDKPRDNDQHCCGCPNHSHDRKSSGGVRIEEQEPNMGHSLVPSRGENFSYPVLLIPPEYMKNKEQKKQSESDGAAQEKPLREIMPHQNVKSQEQVPQEKYSWFPIDMKSLQSLLQGDNGRKTQEKDENNVKRFPVDMKSQSLLQGENGRRTEDQKDEDNMKRFPFPIIWMTPNHKQGEDDEEKGKMNGFPAIVKDAVPGDSASPEKLLNNGRGIDEAQDIHENVSADLEPREKSTLQKIIPVKPMEVPKEREIPEGAERRGRTVSPKKRNDSEMEKLSGAGARRDSSSPPKTKLPPVCLRVDPLPRKKRSSASSRSPSPPGSKGTLQEKGQTYQDSEARESAPSSNKAVEEKHTSGAGIQVEEKRREEKKGEERRNDFTGIPVVPFIDSSVRKTQQNDNVKPTAEGNKGSESSVGSTIKQENEKKETNNVSRSTNVAVEEDKKELSADEAAIRIQSAYRGYQVRNWEPMKKLKQIAEVREKMVELKSKINSLESSPDLQKDERQTAVFGEMIMRLLLKLDTIQGLPPSFRDVRKSLARELVMLQEKLDSLHKAIYTEKPSNNQEGKFGDAIEHSSEGMPHSVNVVSKNQDEVTCNPPCAIEGEQRETVNDVQVVDKAQNSPSNELKEVVDNGKLESSMVKQPDRAAGEVTLQSPSEESVSDNIAEPKSNCDDSSQKLDGSQGATSEEPVASAEEQMEETVLEDKTDSASSESGSSTKVDDLGDSARVVEIVNELPVGVIEDEEPQQHKQAGLSTKVDDSGDSALVVEIVNELPVGVIEYEEPQQHKQAGSPHNDALLLDDGVGEKSAADVWEAQLQEMKKLNTIATESRTSSVEAEVLNENESEKQLTEGSGKVENEDNSLTGETVLGETLQESQASEAGDAIETSPEETQPDSALLPEKVIADEVPKEVNQETVDAIENNVPVFGVEEQTEERGADQVQKEVNQETNNADESSISEAANAAISNDEERTRDDQDRGEEVKQGESQETVDVPISDKSELSRDDVFESKRESSTTPDKLSMAEENVKMREMVKKLLESGKEQSAVISNLTERLNELEQKLKQRKTKGRRHRRLVSPPSRKPSVQKRAVTADA